MQSIYSYISKILVSTKYSGNRNFGLVWFCAVVAEMQPHIGMAATGVHERVSTAAFVRICSVLVIKEDEFLGNMHPKHLLTVTGESQKIKWRVDRHQYLRVCVAILSMLNIKKTFNFIDSNFHINHLSQYVSACVPYTSVPDR